MEILSPAEDMKLTIIENFINYYFSNEKKRDLAKECAYQYVIQDHVNELAELLPNKREEIKW